MNNYEKLIAIVGDLAKDANKFYNKGNKSAGTRLRKKMQKIKLLAQDVRVEILEIKKAAND